MEKIEGYLSFRSELGRSGQIIARAISGKIILGNFNAENCLGVVKVREQGNYYKTIEKPMVLLRPSDDPVYSQEREYCVVGNYPKAKISFGHEWCLCAKSVVIPVETGLKKVF